MLCLISMCVIWGVYNLQLNNTCLKVETWRIDNDMSLINCDFFYLLSVNYKLIKFHPKLVSI